MKTRVLLFFFAFVSWDSTAFAGAFKSGIEALNEGNFAKAYCNWKPLAERGHPGAQYNLAWLYANGNGMRVNVKQALFWWEKAAKTGYADAELAMGLAYLNGEGIDQSIDTAMEWFISAARHNNQDARDIIDRLVSNPNYQIIKKFPQLTDYEWFGKRAQIVVDRANIRKGASTQHSVINVKNKGDWVRVIKEQGNWSLIMFYSESTESNATGWIFNKLIKKTAS